MTDIWPFVPLLGCNERLQFYGEVLGGRVSEQRLDLRGRPRQIINYPHRLPSLQYARAKALARINGAQLIHVPIWWEAIKIPGAVAATSTSLTFDTTRGDWRVGGSLVLWQADDDYEVAEIATISPTGVTLVDPLNNNFSYPHVMPVRSAHMVDGMRNTRNTVLTDINVSFHVRDNIDLSDLYTSTYPTYLGLDVVTDKPTTLDDVSELIDRTSAYIDSGLGMVTQETRTAFAQWGQTLVFWDPRTDVWKRRLWLHSLYGTQGTFWMPSFNQDLQPVDSTIGAADTTFDVTQIAPAAWYIDQHIMFEKKDGTRYFREITNASNTGNVDTLTIAALGSSVNTADLHMVCFLAKSRVADDEINIVHRFELDSLTIVPTIEVPDS